jgi:hypothetical protein
VQRAPSLRRWCGPRGPDVCPAKALATTLPLRTTL